MLPEAPVPCVPEVPALPAVLEPATQAHSPAVPSLGSNTQTSLYVAPESLPPNIQRRPPLSVQVEDPRRACGQFVVLNEPRVPYEPAWPPTVGPPTSVQVLESMLNFHKSLKTTGLFPAESIPKPPNNQTFPVPSVQTMPAWRPPGDSVAPE